MIFKEFHDYIIHDDGRIFSLLSNKYLKGDVTIHGYIQYTLSINQERVRYKAHKLVAMLFIENPNNYKVINHIDGNKLNNHYLNLEWCTFYHNNKHARDTGLNPVSKSNSERWNNKSFRDRTSKKISQTLKDNNTFSHKSNPRFKYLVTNSHGVEFTRQDIQSITGLSLSTIDSWIKRCSEGEYYKPFDDNDLLVINTKDEVNRLSKAKHT